MPSSAEATAGPALPLTKRPITLVVLDCSNRQANSYARTAPKESHHKKNRWCFSAQRVMSGKMESKRGPKRDTALVQRLACQRVSLVEVETHLGLVLELEHDLDGDALLLLLLLLLPFFSCSPSLSLSFSPLGLSGPLLVADLFGRLSGCSPDSPPPSGGAHVRPVVESDPPCISPPRHVSIRRVALLMQRILTIHLSVFSSAPPCASTLSPSSPCSPWAFTLSSPPCPPWGSTSLSSLPRSSLLTSLLCSS